MATMSRKHRQVADILAAELAIAVNTEAGIKTELAICNIIHSIADMFKQDNSRFDRDKFYAACGLVQVEGMWK